MKGKILTDYKLTHLPILETKKLLLRPMILKDTELVVKWRNAGHVAEFSRNKSTFTKDIHVKWFNKTRYERIDYIIIVKETHNPIGSVSFKLNDTFVDRYIVEMGKYIGEPTALGHGYAKETMKKWIDFGLNWCGFKRIIAMTRFDNQVNIHINEGLGLKKMPNAYGGEPNWLFMYIDKKKK